MGNKRSKSNPQFISHAEREKIFADGLALEEKLNREGKSMYSDDFACKILAYLLCFGGGNENVVYGKIAFPIKVAQKKLNLYGGEVPNPKLLPLLQKYIQEIADNGSNVSWLSEISERYNLTIPNYDKLPEYGKRKRPINFDALLGILSCL